MKDDAVYLNHILEAVERILAYAPEARATFDEDVKTQDAVIRNLQVVGEAAKKVSAATRAAHPEIPWKNMTGLRDRVVHDYFGVSLDIVWDVIENHLLALRDSLRGIIRSA